MTASPATFRAPGSPSRTVPYLRAVVTTRCNLACTYCHAEGDPALGGMSGDLKTAELIEIMLAGLRNGVRKAKLLGGEPLVRKDLPEVIAAIRAADGSVDISLITAGAVGVGALDAAFAAGLNRANLSIHGWTPDAFAARTLRQGGHAFRAKTLDYLLARGRFLKLNYVWRGQQDDDDLALLLSFAAGKPVVVGLLDELSLNLGPKPLMAAVARLRGPWAEAAPDPDPHSLPTVILRWHDGLAVEIKTSRLGDVAPWAACGSCPKRSRCGEGVHALRLTHDGLLRPCMDRPELGVDLRAALNLGGAGGVDRAWSAILARSCA